MKAHLLPPDPFEQRLFTPIPGHLRFYQPPPQSFVPEMPHSPNLQLPSAAVSGAPLQTSVQPGAYRRGQADYPIDQGAAEMMQLQRQLQQVLQMFNIGGQ